ncbi:MAG: hypothetical protein CM1200mP28_11790 [Deltaproteobacteria bacterium]|nr:MAG: hypothetical protein CM1200mP28_11790 [Deltaproteobacteria bacterium]
MDSLVLEDILIDKESKGEISPKEYILMDESGKKLMILKWEWGTNTNFYLKSEEKPETDLTETDLVPRSRKTQIVRTGG